MNPNTRTLRRRLDFVVVPLALGCAVVAMVWLAGCMAAPRPKTIARIFPDQPQVFALLPVQGADVRVTLDDAPAYNEVSVGLFTKSQESAQRTADSALDALATRGGSVVGPSASAKQLGPEERARLTVYLNDPGPLTEAWKQQGLAVIARKLGGAALVRTRIIVRYTHAIAARASVSYDPDADGAEATIVADLDQIDATSGRVVGHGRGEGAYRNGSSAGVVASAAITAAVPYVPATSFTRAVEMAIQRAWQNLLAPPAAATAPAP